MSFEQAAKKVGGESVPSRKLLVVTYDVTGWTINQIEALAGQAAAQGESEDGYAMSPADYDQNGHAVGSHPDAVTQTWIEEPPRTAPESGVFQP